VQAGGRLQLHAAAAVAEHGDALVHPAVPPRAGLVPVGHGALAAPRLGGVLGGAVAAADVAPLDGDHTPLGVGQLLVGPHGEVHVVHVAAAPALVGGVVAGVVARASVGDHHDDRGGLIVADVGAVQPRAVAVLETDALAPDLLALAVLR